MEGKLGRRTVLHEDPVAHHKGGVSKDNKMKNKKDKYRKHRKPKRIIMTTRIRKHTERTNNKNKTNRTRGGDKRTEDKNIKDEKED